MFIEQRSIILFQIFSALQKLLHKTDYLVRKKSLISTSQNFY